MAITVKFFASLREKLGKTEVSLPADDIQTAQDAWNAAVAHVEMPSNTLVAINMEYAPKEKAVNDGDEVAFFPPVTGG
jgi:molybdopterin synthase sulfur carrier subunit